jgi:hypothetical protein
MLVYRHQRGKGDLPGKQKEEDEVDHGALETESGQNEVDNLLKSLSDIKDILRNPRFSQLHRDDYGKFKKPKADERTQSVLKKFEAVIVQFYKDRGESGSFRRHRWVNEVIYGAGPTKITETPTYFAQFIFKEQPKFTWIHLPSINVSL